jgi:hypothetical protein
LSARTDRENYGPQLEAIESAQQALRDRLEDLDEAVTEARRSANTKAFKPDILKIQSAWLSVDRASDDIAIALTDLATAKGEGI